MRQLSNLCSGGNVIAGLLATWIPARRALAIEPSILMREE
jgi:ABC-type lipoprotein release transport system permease subunit